jgi:pectate lyase
MFQWLSSSAFLFFTLFSTQLAWSLEGQIGWGAVTTGGKSEKLYECRVINLKDSGPGSLRECAERIGPAWIKFNLSGTITLLSPIKPTSDKTFDGRGQNILITGKKMFLFDIRSSNIIVGDLKFQVQQDAGSICANPLTSRDTVGCGAGVSVRGNIKNIWIHHSIFSKCGEKCIVSGYDYYGYVPDQISISHNTFLDSFFAILIDGVPPSTKVNPIHSRVSIYNNHFRNIKRRSPRISGLVKGHVFNNYIQQWGKENVTACENGDPDFAFAASSVGEALLLLENNVFVPSLNSACNKATDIWPFDNRDAAANEHLGIGRVRASGNLLLRKATLAESLPTLVPNPAYPYTLLSTEEVVLKVRAEARPRP